MKKMTGIPIIFISGGNLQEIWDLENKRLYKEDEYELIDYDNIRSAFKCPICETDFAEETNYCKVCDIDWNNVDNDQVVEVLQEVYAQQESA
jgi:protein tyrosine/serine phosphatase